MFDILFEKHGVKSSNAAQNFFYLLASGLSEQKDAKVNVQSLLPINASEQNKIWWKSAQDIENNITFNTIPLINIPIIRHLGVNLYVFFQILFKRFSPNYTNIIIVDFLRLTLNVSILAAAKIRGIKVLTVITDMPGENVLNQSFSAQIKDKIAVHLNYDYYVCLTKQLNEQLNRKSKPYVIIESFANIRLQHIPNRIEDKFQERVVVYAGSLYERYGLKTLIKAFMQLPDKDLRLYLYGVGPFIESIDSFTKQDNRVQYKGVLKQSALIDILFRSTLLVNPRPSHELYTLYSFPSKNIEYMSTGTPLLTTKLSGIPSDHYPYIFTIEDETVEGVKSALQDTLKMDKAKLHAFGLEAKEFVMSAKNNVFQASKILSIIDK
jgi:glycosyltransferase involved in cell wall biosynthesis